MTTGKKWTDEEQRTICIVYAAMLAAEQEGIKYNKAAIRRAVLPLLDGRSGGSYEMKMCNISAAVISSEGQTHETYVKGYKPLPGYQRSLKTWIDCYRTGGNLYAKIEYLQKLEILGKVKK